MNRCNGFATRLIVVILSVFILIGNAMSQEKLAQTGFQFLSVSSDARGVALGDAMTTVDGGSGSLFFNPAGMSRMGRLIDVAISWNEWLADIRHNAISIAISPFMGRYGVIGMSLISVDYGDIQGTMVWGNEEGWIDTEILNPTAFAVGIGYGIALTDKFSVGGQIKYAGQQLGKSVVPVGDSLGVKKNIAFAPAFDFGTIYRTGFKSLAFGMSVRNFSSEIKYEEEGFQLPLTFSIGISMDMTDLFYETGAHSLLLSVDAVHPRDYHEYINLGLEYRLMDMLLVRWGYMPDRDERVFAYGFGLNLFGLNIDYSYTPYERFDDVQRITLRFSI